MELQLMAVQRGNGAPVNGSAEGNGAPVNGSAEG